MPGLVAASKCTTNVQDFNLESGAQEPLLILFSSLLLAFRSYINVFTKAKRIWFIMQFLF